MLRKAYKIATIDKEHNVTYIKNISFKNQTFETTLKQDDARVYSIESLAKQESSVVRMFPMSQYHRFVFAVVS